MSENISEPTIMIEPKPELEIKPVAELEIKNKPLYSVRVNHLSLRRRSTPEIAENVVGVITDKGVYEIYEERNGWGRLEDESWIMLKYTEKYNKL
jgi:hypothetical protein